MAKKLKLTIRERLCDMLREYGVVLTDEGIVGVTGYWRGADVFRWETTGAKVEVDPGLGLDGHGIAIVSWNTMTACVHNGFTIVKETPWWWEVHANEPVIKTDEKNTGQ